MKISSVNGDPNCKICKGSAWVCEKHPEVPAFHDDPDDKIDGKCPGPGMPCQCSPIHKDNWEKTMKEQKRRF